ncbi:MAG: hypothetical protein ACYC7D_11780 [Nitrososphaerales archaeon]
MRKDLIRYSSAIGAGAALMILYLTFIVKYYFVADLSSLTQIEKWILVTQVLRLAVLLVLKRRFQLPPLVPIIMFSIESLLIPPLLILYVTTGDSIYALAMGTVLTAWMGATAIILSPYLVYAFTRSMLEYNSLLGVLALSGLEFAYYIFIATLVSEASSPIVGLTGLGAYLVGSLRNQATTVGVPLPSTDILIAGASVLFFISLLIYSTMGVHNLDARINLGYVLFIPLIAIMVALIWTFLSVGIISSVYVPMSSDVFVVVTLPTFVLAVIIWGGARGKE